MSATAHTPALTAGGRVSSPVDRLLPLAGPGFFLVLLGSSVAAGETPAEHASGAKVLSLFSRHASAQEAATLAGALGVVLLILFATRLRTYLRDAGADTLGLAAYSGALMVGIGGAIRGGAAWELAQGHDALSPGAAQALNAVYSTHYPAITGIAVLMAASSVAIVRTGALPRWMGWAAGVIALAALAPPTLAPLIATGVWTAVAGGVIFVRDGAPQNQT